ncbi:MAG: hypothetical protein LBM93_12970 [Oscillospiraceae bacterium]|jgi:hypothetical protein|nr:hypothetical protein [Oscillospiraceae bacterium]
MVKMFLIFFQTLLIIIAFILKFYKDFSVITLDLKFIVISFLFVLIVATQTFINLSIKGKNSAIVSAKVLYIYRYNKYRYGCVCEWQSDQGIITISALIDSNAIKGRLLSAFPQKYYEDPPLMGVSSKTYMNTEKYKKWFKELPYDFEYPEVIVRYNEKFPKRLVKIIG